MRRAAGIVAAATLLAGSLGAARAAERAPGCATADREYVYLTTLEIETKLPKGRFSPRDTVPFPTLVTRPADEDPVGNGIPLPRPHYEPAADVPITLVAFAGDVLLIDFTITNAEGKADLALDLPWYTPAGPVPVRLYAQKLLLDLNCIVIYEIGELTINPAFEVERRG